jgi:xanthosine utilization system XapX-like protein
MFIAHFVAGIIFGIVFGTLLYVSGSPLWVALFGYGLTGACITLISALWQFASAEARRHGAWRVAS